jgi:hypothetical protein
LAFLFMNGSYQRLMLMPQKTPQGLKARSFGDAIAGLKAWPEGLLHP